MTQERKAKLQTLIVDYLIITLGVTLYVLGWVLFLIPHKIAGGGITGVAVVIKYFGDRVGMDIPIPVSFFLINAVLVLIARKMLGAKFGNKTIYSILLMTALWKVVPYLQTPIIDDMFLSAILAAIMGGFGIGLIFTRGGSTGGTDIIAMIINKYRNVSPGKIIMYCDVIIIGSNFFISDSPDKLVYGFVNMWVLAYAIDAFLNGANASAQIFIFSKRFDEIADYINEEAGRGVTILEGTGWYTKDKVKIIMTVVRKRESSLIFRELKQIDPDAFISMGSVMGVYGKGFDNIKI